MLKWLHTIAGVFKALLLIGFISFGFFATAVYLTQQANEELTRANESMFASNLLADELRQSSDDLTRMARTYVATGDQRYKDHFNEIIAIRDGKIARPQEYWRIYWDLVLPGKPAPRPRGDAKALLDLMREAGFSNAELEKLEQAKRNSDDLVNLELEAMQIVDSLTERSSSGSLEQIHRAMELLHSPLYHEYKAGIMKPVDEFFVMVFERTAQRITDAKASVRFYLWLTAVSAVLALLSLTLMAVVTKRRAFDGWISIQRSIKKVASGQADTIEGASRDDEIGDMARALNKSHQEAEEVAGRVTAMINREFETITQSIQGASHDLVKASKVFQDRANIRRELSTEASNAIDACDQEIGAVNRFTASLTQSVNNIGTQIQRSQALSKATVEQTEANDRIVSEMAGAAERVGEIVSLISEIAEQTNLLALNATIEAARAGDAGRGFAVVAQEVKSLAAQTAGATADITSQIESIQSVSKAAVEAMKRIRGSIKEVDEATSSVADAVDQQTKATQDISLSCETAASLSQSAAGNIKKVLGNQGEIAETMEKLRGISADLVSNSDKLKTTVDNVVLEISHKRF